jgi:digeranylgeranylglycerophospholipid reductase
LRKYDAVVVGAGPAGSMTAYEIARAGYGTLLLEKHKQPGLPLCCAEGISMGAMNQLFDTIEPAWLSSEIDRFVMVAPDGSRAAARSERRGYILDRPRFDYDLAHRARKAGADLVCEAIGQNPIKSRKRFVAIEAAYPDGRTDKIEAGVFVAADGVESQLARSCGLPNRLGLKESLVAFQYRLQGPDFDTRTIEFHFGNRLAPQGYIWIFPKSPSSANVGICMASNKQKDNPAKGLLDRFIARRFGGAEVISRHCGLIPIYRGEHMMRISNLLVVGDAARVVESLSGAGLALGMVSGVFAGRAAAKFLSGEVASLTDLDKAYPGEFLKAKKEEMVRYARMRRAFEQMTDRDLNCIIKSLNDMAGDYNNSGINVGKLLWTILTTHPRLLRLARFMI